MKRGPLMPRGIALAIPLALKRGHVMVFIRTLLNLGEFLITGNGQFVLVGVRFARKFLASIAEIEAEFAEVITGLRLVPRAGPVSCELWLYSRYGSLRHFRICDAGLVELDSSGTPLDQLKPVASGISPNSDNVPMPTVTAAAGSPAHGTPDTRSHILRWLKKWNAARVAGKGSDAMGSSELKKILDAGEPGPITKRASGKKPVSKNVAALADPEKNPGPEKPDAVKGRKPGKKPADMKTAKAVPEVKPGPGSMDPGDPPAPPAGNLPAVKEQTPDLIPGSTDCAREEGEI